MTMMRLTVVALVAMLLPLPAHAGVTVSVVQHDNVVQGTTAGALMVSLNKHPVAGDSGRAYASTHVDFTLSLRPVEKGGMCSAKVDVGLRIAVTLPRAASRGGMSGSVRRAWDEFVSFTRTHEAHHQASYVDCAKRLVTAAERKSDRQCAALGPAIGRMFKQMQADCEIEQGDFDREQRPIVGHMDLFMMAQLDLLN